MDFSPALLLALLAPGALAQAGRRLPGGLEPGVPGTAYPQPVDVVRADAPVHTDESGGADQILLALCGAAEGYAAVWRDTRAGNLGLYVAFLDRGAAPLGVELPVHPPVTSRQLEPALALGPGLAGAVAWTFTTMGRAGPHLRAFDGPRGFRRAPPTPLVPAPDLVPEPAARGVRAGRAALAGGGGVQDVALLEGGGTGVAVWRAGERVFASRFEIQGGRQRAAQGELLEGAHARGSVRVAASRAGAVVGAWTSARGVRTRALWRETSSVHDAGAGELIALVADPRADAGSWLLARAGDALELRHLDGQGRADAAARAAGAAARACDLAACARGLALLVEHEPGAGGAAFELRAFDFAGEPGAALALDLPSGASGARIAARGPDAAELLLAWSERTRDGDFDVRFRLLGSGAPVEGRWNSDRASSDQSAPALAAAGGRALVAWQDARGGRDAIFVRALAPDGSFATPERELGEPRPDAPPERAPALALAADGGGLALWRRQERGGWQLVAQALGNDARPIGVVRPVDPGERVADAGAAALTPLAAGGYLAVWARAGDGAFARVLSASGELAGAPWALGSARGATAGNPDVALLDGGGAIAAWDERVGRGAPGVRARRVDPERGPLGDVLVLAPAPFGAGDLDPSVAPGLAAVPDSFLIAWTANEGPTRDVWARVLDARGGALAPLLYLSVKANEQDYPDAVRLSDGSWVVAWEDDISGRDHAVARRIASDFTLGPRVTLDERAAEFVEDRTAPALAPLCAGFAAVFVDRRRSQGQDVYLRVLGSGFDGLR